MNKQNSHSEFKIQTSFMFWRNLGEVSTVKTCDWKQRKKKFWCIIMFSKKIILIGYDLRTYSIIPWFIIIFIILLAVSVNQSLQMIPFSYINVVLLYLQFYDIINIQAQKANWCAISVFLSAMCRISLRYIMKFEAVRSVIMFQRN